MRAYELDYFGLGQALMADSRECDNEPLGSIKKQGHFLTI
jgi:hypothetical protein